MQENEIKTLVNYAPVTRKINKTIINLHQIDEHDEIKEIDPLIVMKKIGIARAYEYVRKYVSKQNVFITNIEHVQDEYTMKLTDFIKAATKTQSNKKIN